MLSLYNSVVIALLTVVASLVVAIPAGLALARGRLPWRGLILVAFLVPQAFPAVAVHINIARIFYGFELWRPPRESALELYPRPYLGLHLRRRGWTQEP